MPNAISSSITSLIKLRGLFFYFYQSVFMGSRQISPKKDTRGTCMLVFRRGHWRELQRGELVGADVMGWSFVVVVVAAAAAAAVDELS